MLEPHHAQIKRVDPKISKLEHTNAETTKDIAKYHK